MSTTTTEPLYTVTNREHDAIQNLLWRSKKFRCLARFDALEHPRRARGMPAHENLAEAFRVSHARCP